MRTNIVALVGRLTADPDTRQVGPKAWSSFRLAVPRPGRNRPANFVTVVCWERLAETVASYAAKARRVAVVGELTSQEWTGGDGARHERTVVTAHSVEFLDPPPGQPDDTNDSAAEAQSDGEGGDAALATVGSDVSGDDV